MNAHDAHYERDLLRYRDNDGQERTVRRVAESLVKEFDITKHLVLERRIPWRSRLRASFVEDGLNPAPTGPVTFTVQIPGDDFAAQLVVEQQIREQIAALP